MDFKNILEGARPFFQGLPQPLSQSSPANSEPASTNAKEKDATGSLSHNHNQTYHSSVITNHNSGSGLSRNGNNAALPYSATNPISNETASDGSMNNNNNNNKSDKDSSGGSVSKKNNHSVNSISPSVASQNPSNSSGKSGSSGSGAPSHPLLHGGFANALPHSQRSSSNQSHVPIHVPLTIPLPTHHQERSISRPKYEEGLGATLSQMYAGTLAGSRGSSQGRHMNGAPTGLLQTAPPINNANHGVANNVSVVGGGGSGSVGSSVTGAVSKNMGGTSVRRESPLDLSVKTVRQSADSSTPLEIPSSGMNGSVSGGGARSLSGSGASTPNLLIPTMNQLHYPLHSLSDGHSSVSSVTGSARPLTVGDTMNSVIAAVANSTTGVGLSSNESRSSSKSGRGRSREKSHERENSSSRSRTSTPTGNGGALRYPSPAHIHRQQSPSGTASPHLHQRVSTLQLNIPNPTPPPRTASGSSVNSVSAGGYNPSSTPQPLHPSPAVTPGATTPHHMYSQHPYAPSPIPPGATCSAKGMPPGMPSYHSHYPGIPTPSHHPSQTNSSSSGSQHSNGLPPSSSAVPTGSSSASTVSSGSHHSQQQSKHNSTIPPYNPPPPSFGTSLNSGYPPPSAHHHQSSYPQYHQYPPHHVPPPSHSVPPQSHAPPLSHHPHHAYYSSVYGHHAHLQQPPPPPIGAPHQRNTPSLPPTSSSGNASTSAPIVSGTSQSPAPGSNSSTPTPSSAHSSQYLSSKHAGYAYPPSTQPSQPLPSTQASATTHSYYHGNPSANSYYSAPHQPQQAHGTASNQIPAQPQSRPPSTSNQHLAAAYPPSHYGHSQNPPASTTPYSHSQQHLYPSGISPLNYPTYVPQAQRTQTGSYPPVQQGYPPPQSPYYQGPPGLRPSTPTGPPPPTHQTSASYPTAHPPSSHASTPAAVIPPGKGSPSSAEASDMKPPQNPSTSGKSPKSRKNLLHMLRNSVENRMSEKQDKDKFQFNHQTWNFHGKKYNTTLPQLNNANNNGQIPPGGVASPGGTGFASRPGSPSGSSAHSVDALSKASTGQQSSKYDSGSSSYGGSSSTASSTHGNNAGSEGSTTSGIGSLSDSSHYNRIRTKAEKKQLFPNLLSQIEQENSHKEAEKLLQQQQQQQQYLQSGGNFYVPPITPAAAAAASGGHGGKGGSSSNALNSSSSKNKLTNSTSVFDFRDEDDDLMGSKRAPQVPPPALVATGTTTIPPIAVPEGKPLKKPRSPKKAAEPGARRNSLPKASKGEKLPKKVKQTPQQQQELMAAVIDSVAAASSHAAAAEAHKKYLDSLKNKDLSLSTTAIAPGTKEPSTLTTPLRIPNPSAIAREIVPPPLPLSLSSEKDAKGTTSTASSITNSGAAADSKPTGTSGGSKSAVVSTALESMDVFLDVCDSFLDDLQSNPVSIKSRRGGLWQKLKEKAKPKAGDGNNVDVAAPVKVRKGRVGPRLKKNSSEEDSDFEVEKSSEEDDEEEDEDESEHSDKSDSDESNSLSDVSGKGSNSGDSSGIQRSSKKGAALKKKKKRVIESEDENSESGNEGKDAKASGDEKSARGRNGSRSASSKKRSVSKATSKAESSDVGTNKGSSRRGSERRGKGESARGRSGGRGGAKGSRRISARKRKTVLRNKSGITSLSDLDEDEDATSRTSIGSESDASVDSDSEASSFDDSSMSDDSDSNGLSGDSDSEEDSDGQSFTSSRKRKKSMTTGGKKAKRARLSKSKKRGEKDRKSRKSGKKNKTGTKRTRSSSTKNGKPGSRSTSTNGKKDKENIQDSEFSDDDSSVDIKKSRSLRSRSRGQKQGGTRKLRPKRNCAPAPGNGKLKDISESDEEVAEGGGSSGEEWIMRTELGKNKRRIVFGDGSEFQRPGWEEELIDFKKNKLRMPHKLIRVSKPSSLSLSPSGNGAQSTTSSITGAITETGVSPAKSTKENKSPSTPAKGSKQQRQKEKSPEKDLPDLIKEKPVEKETKEKKPKGRASKAATATSAPGSTTSTPSKVDNATPTKKERISKKEKEPAVSTDKPSKGKGKGAKSKVVVEKKPDISESSLDEPAIGRVVEQMNAAAKRDCKSGSSNNVSASVKATIDAVVKSSEKKDDQVNSESKGKKASSSAASKAGASNSGDSATPNAGAGNSSETLPLPNAEIPSPSSSASAATTTPVAKKALRRNKFKSGFDYIRKKKKSAAADGSAAAPPPKRVKSAAEKNTNVEDIQAEVRSWVLNKGLGETALHRAARLGYPDVAAWCLDTDTCQPNCKDNAGYTPLHETCIKGNLEVAKVLLRYGANPSQAAPGGIRPLHEACENGHVELVRLLISYGADPTVATYGGQTPLELAENHEPVKLLLQQHISDVQGREDRRWEFRGSGCWSEIPFDSGYDVTDDPPLAEPDLDDMDGFEFEASEMPLPTLYRLKDHNAHYVLLNEVLSYLKQPRDKILEKLPGVEVVELNSNDFLEQAHCCHLLGEKFNFNAISELTLVRYDDRMKRMLGVESCRIK